MRRHPRGALTNIFEAMTQHNHGSVLKICVVGRRNDPNAHCRLEIFVVKNISHAPHLLLYPAR